MYSIRKYIRAPDNETFLCLMDFVPNHHVKLFNVNAIVSTAMKMFRRVPTKMANKFFFIWQEFSTPPKSKEDDGQDS